MSTDPYSDFLSENNVGVDESPYDIELQKRLKIFDDLLESLSNEIIGSDRERIEESFNHINKYLKNYRFLYSSVHKFLYNKDLMSRVTLNENVKTIYKYKLKDKECDISVVEKLYDYTNLSIMQRNNIQDMQENINNNNALSNEIKNNVKDANKKIEILNKSYNKYKKEIENYKEKFENSKSEFSNNLIGLIALFISVAFIVFGGISGLSGMSEPLVQVIKTGKNSVVLFRALIFWALGLFNLLSMVMFFISKFLEKSFDIKSIYITANAIFIVILVVTLFIN